MNQLPQQILLLFTVLLVIQNAKPMSSHSNYCHHVKRINAHCILKDKILTIYIPLASILMAEKYNCKVITRMHSHTTSLFTLTSRLRKNDGKCPETLNNDQIMNICNIFQLVCNEELCLHVCYLSYQLCNPYYPSLSKFVTFNQSTERWCVFLIQSVVSYESLC